MVAAATLMAPGDGRKWWALAAICMAQLLVVIDVTVINVAMPSAQRDLGMSDASRQWMISAYTLTFGGFLLLGGRLGDRFGRRRSLLIGLCGFVLASAMGGAAVDPAMVIAARAMQGASAALLAPVTLSLLAVRFPDGNERTRALGVFALVMLSGGVAGLLLGGFLAQFLGWRWCLYINIPLAVTAGGAGRLLLPAVEGRRKARLDWWSALACTAGMAALVYGLSETVSRGWGSAFVIGALVIAIILLGGFVVRQARVAYPLLPLSIFVDRNRVGTYVAMGFLSFGMFGVWFFLTYQLQAVMGYGPLHTGLAFVPMMAGNLAGRSRLSVRLVSRASPARLFTTRLLLSAGGMILLTLLTPETSYWNVILPAELLLGYGAGLAIPTVINTVVTGVATEDAGAASALFQTSTLVGASLGTAVLSTIAVATTARAADPRSAAGLAHGYSIAAACASAVLLAGALFIALFLRGSRYIDYSKGGRQVRASSRSLKPEV